MTFLLGFILLGTGLFIFYGGLSGNLAKMIGALVGQGQIG